MHTGGISHLDGSVAGTMYMWEGGDRKVTWGALELGRRMSKKAETWCGRDKTQRRQDLLMGCIAADAMLMMMWRASDIGLYMRAYGKCRKQYRRLVT
jgi:hypothetical protein